MTYEVPEFSKLTELIPGEIPMHDRALFFHWPSNTVLELLPDLEEQIKSYDGPKFHWERKGPDGEMHRALFVVHRTILEGGAELNEVIEKAKEWYGQFLDWLNTSDDALDDYFDQQGDGDDLPN